MAIRRRPAPDTRGPAGCRAHGALERSRCRTAAGSWRAPRARPPSRDRPDPPARRHRARDRDRAFPVVRGLTRRLERLQDGVETLGAGNLAARVKVEGCDEVARLAQSFNRSAARIEELVNAHRLLLAHASHEIRTPLSRIRLGIELLSQQPGPEIQGRSRTGHRRTRRSGRRHPAREPARHEQDLAAARDDRPAGARGRGRRALRRLQYRRRAGHRHRRSAAACAT